MIERFNPSTVHEPAGYSHVTISEAGRLAHLAGQCPLNVAGEVVGDSGDFAAQTAQLITNCLAVLEAAGATPADVVRSVVYVVSPDSDVLSAVWRQLTASPLAAAFTTASTLVGGGRAGLPRAARRDRPHRRVGEQADFRPRGNANGGLIRCTPLPPSGHHAA